MNVKISMEGHTLLASLTGIEDFSKYEYAFYLHVDYGDTIKKWYSDSPTIEFDLSENGVHYVTAFLKDRATGKVSTMDSDAFYYLRGRKPGIVPFLRIEEMEVTNYCNLSCDNCCTPTSKYPRGYIDDRTVLAALSWTRKGQTLNYHRIGEPLLHKSLVKYVSWGVEAGVKPVLSTNGILLDRDRLKALYEAGLRHLVITLHTQESLRNFLEACAYFESEGIEAVHFDQRHNPKLMGKMFFAGKVLDFPDGIDQGKDVRQAIECMPEKAKAFLQITPAHTWAGNVPDTQQDFAEDIVAKRQKACYFLQHRVVNMRWDGTIVGCCFDSENENEIGHIRDYPAIRMDLPKYHLCRHCDANWATFEAQK